jgi:hypothetical protein
MNRRMYGSVIGAALCLSACGQTEIPRNDLRAVVERDTVRFSNDALPEALLARIARSRVVVFGEYHQDSEHYAFMSALVVALHSQGVRQLLLEWPHAWDWELVAAVEEGYDPVWTPRDPNIGAALVDAVCRFNRTLPAAERIRVRAIDINFPGYGGATDFATAVSCLSERLVDGTWLSKRLAGYGSQADESRIRSLETLRDDLVRERSSRAALWGEARVDRVIETVEIELASIPIRARWDRDADLAMALREDAMKHLCDLRLAETNGKTVINVGMDHAQKSQLNGIRQEWLGDYLVHRSPVAGGSTETVAVVPARGETYVNGAIASVDIARSSPPNELLRTMSETAGGKTAFLALDDPLFERDEVPVNSLAGVQVCAPKRHFDAFVLLPEAHLTQRSSATKLTQGSH